MDDEMCEMMDMVYKYIVIKSVVFCNIYIYIQYTSYIYIV